MPRKTPKHPPESPSPFSKSKGTAIKWIRDMALQGPWSDVCVAIFIEWYSVWKKRPQSQELNWPEFRRQVQEGARRFWFSDLMRDGRKGRPSVEDKCFQAIESYISSLPKRFPDCYPDPTQGDLIRAVKHRFPKLKEPTCRKYARLWQLLNKKSGREYTKSDWKFLEQHHPDDAGMERFALLSSKDRSEALKVLAQDLAKMNKLPL